MVQHPACRQGAEPAAASNQKIAAREVRNMEVGWRIPLQHVQCSEYARIYGSWPDCFSRRSSYRAGRKKSPRFMREAYGEATARWDAIYPRND
jgi:hypothetical protein